MPTYSIDYSKVQYQNLLWEVEDRRRDSIARGYYNLADFFARLESDLRRVKVVSR